MKTKILWLFGSILLLPTHAYLQNNNTEKIENFLKNYKAPDFKVKQLQFTSQGYGAFGSTSENSETSLQGRINYQYFSNSSRYQGTISTTVSGNYGKRSLGVNLSNRLALIGSFWHVGRLYHKRNRFFGLYGGVGSTNLWNQNLNNPIPFRLNQFGATPAVSYGFGRLEPVQYARNAMDIEKSLDKGGRLNREFTVVELNQLAKRLAEINNVRFYDFRLRRIEQFEEIDAVLSDFEIVSEKDMKYFAYLSDAYLYAQNQPRTSGMINEVGVRSEFTVISITPIVEPVEPLSPDIRIGTFGFYNFEWSIPQSYAIQHNFKAGANITLGNSLQTGVYFPTWLNSSYTFGLYPTTRTYMALTAEIGANFDKVEAMGYGSSLNYEFQYYISPRVRFNADARLFAGENYRRHGFFLQSDFIQSQSESYLNYTFDIRFTYAIF